MAIFIVELLCKMDDSDRGVSLRTLFNSYLWELPKVRSLRAAGFEDTQYYACAWGGWRTKNQRLLSNMEEMKLISACCQHKHQKDE